MIIVRFGGGLGNQLFQYALLLSLKKANPDTEVLYDDSSFEYYNEHEGFVVPRYFQFSENGVKSYALSGVCPIRYLFLKRGKKIRTLSAYNFIYKIDTILSAIMPGNHNMVRDRNVVTFDDLVCRDPYKTYYFDGGWQNINVFDLDFLKKRICFNIVLNNADQSYYSMVRETRSISIHIRRGDFLDCNGFDICSEEYYRRAIARLFEITKENQDDCWFYFFGDDHEYIDSTFCDLNNKTIVKGSCAGVDMYIMSNCKYHIISNSTFSFWGAFLDESQGLVIAPKYSFCSGNRIKEFSVPTNWITIQNARNEL